MPDEPKDLIILVADLDMENAVKGLLSNPRRLGIEKPSYRIVRYPGRDSGCFTPVTSSFASSSQSTGTPS